MDTKAGSSCVDSDPHVLNLQSRPVSPSRRARELYKYFYPPSFLHTPTVTSPQRNLLKSQAQLVALRLQSRCVINLLDASYQYRVAEAAHTLSLKVDDDDRAQAAPDSMWAECRLDNIQNSVCHYTINAAEPADGSLPFFEVGDLRNDPRFCNGSFVAGEPYFRYYLGVPLRANSGITIGALAIIDPNLREAASEDDRLFMKSVADNIMTYLELERHSQERLRATEMQKSLNRFVDPVRSNLDGLAELRNATSKNTFERAAALLCQSLSLRNEGEVVFLDTAAAVLPSPLSRRASAFLNTNRQVDADISVPQSHSVWFHKEQQCRVIASSSAVDVDEIPSVESHLKLSIPTFVPMPVETLSKLIARYPRGKLWTLDGPTKPSHTKEDTTVESSSPNAEKDIISQYFPQATSLFMLPVWDALSWRWAALFGFSTSRFQHLTVEVDVPHMISFSNCLAHELTRLAAAAADQQKGDFIGSISHELRSPLHGILASCELLQDSGLNDFQKSFIDTANSCGRTLLDTISNILDYSKINNLDRDRRRSRQKKSVGGDSTLQSSISDLSSLSEDPSTDPLLSDAVELASVVEEVVEGAAVGSTFTTFQYLDFDDSNVGSFTPRRVKQSAQSLQVVSIHKPAVEIFLDISHAPESSWLYITQVGSFRRIVLNLVANALKYTQEGWIKVSMNVERIGVPNAQRKANVKPLCDPTLDVINVSIVDTGKGMSTEFLDTKIFMPFAQEDSLAPGTGLGLSMVKGLLDKLDGEIHIESALNRGTSVTVRLPMLRKSDLDTTIPLDVTTTSLVGQESIEFLTQNRLGRKIAFFLAKSDQGSGSSTEVSKITQLCLQQYVNQWFGMELLLQETSSEPHAEIVIAHDFDLEALLPLLRNSRTKEHPKPSIVVLCQSNTPYAALERYRDYGLSMQLLSKPFGPYKLANTIRSCFEKLQNQTESTGDASTPGIRSVSQDTTPHVSNIASPINDNEKSLSIPNDKPSTNTLDLTNGLDIQLKGGVSATAPPQFLDPQEHRRPPRILAVDDNAINLKILVAFLKKLKYSQVTLAYDGAEACDAFEASMSNSEPFDIIFLDLSMPIVDGFEAAGRIRAIEQKYFCGTPKATLIPSPALIVALTGLARQKDQTRAIGAGVDLYMTKPTSFKDIAELMKNWEATGGVEFSNVLPHGPAASVA